MSNRISFMRVLSSKALPAALAASSFLAFAAIVSCGASSAQPKTEAEDPASWRHRGIWTEKKGESTFIMIVGTASNASLDRSMSMDSAEQDARERASIYLGATVQAFRERMTRRREMAAKKADGEAQKAAEQTNQTDRGGRTVAENVVRGMEIVTSFTDKSEDNLYVLGRVDFQSLKKALAEDEGLTQSERQEVAKNSDEVRNEMNAALDEAGAAAKK